MSECARCAARRADPTILCALMLTDTVCAASKPRQIEPKPIVNQGTSDPDYTKADSGLWLKAWAA